jgi:dsDNA-binding SOS-regulon protein
MVYRPSVRYADAYQKYVQELDETTHLDRNQIIRLALFLASHSDEYQSILKKYKKPDTTLPQPHWGRDEDDLWKKQNYIPKSKAPEIRKTVETIRIINKGGIKYVHKDSSLP